VRNLAAVFTLEFLHQPWPKQQSPWLFSVSARMLMTTKQE